MSTHDALSALATTTLRLSAEVGDLKAEIKRIKAVNERLRRNLEASREAHADTKADVDRLAELAEEEIIAQMEDNDGRLMDGTPEDRS